MNAALKPLPAFARESASAVMDEIGYLLEAHYDEVTHHKDIPVGCDFEKYAQADAQGILRIYTVRMESQLVGYDIFTIGNSLHYKSSLQAREDTLFIHPDFRQGLLGYRFLKWVDAQIKLEGVQIMYRHHKLMLDIGPLYKRLGHEPLYQIYWKRLDA